MTLTKIISFAFIGLLLFIQPIHASDSKLLITSDKSVHDKWYKIRSQDAPQFVTTQKAYLEQDLQVIVFFIEPGIDANGNAKIYYDLKIISPDGSTLSEQKNIKVIDGKSTNEKIIRLSQAIPTITFRETPGTFLIQVTVTDKITNAVQTHQKQIEVTEYSYKNFFDDGNTYSKWSSTYYKSLAPEKAIDGFIFSSKFDLKARGMHYFYDAGFYGKVLNDNPYLIPQLLALYSTQVEETKLMILSLLPHLQYDTSEFISSLNDKEKNFYIKWLQTYSKYPVDGILFTPTKIQDSMIICGQLDMLWGNFFASGEYKPIKQLVDVLTFSEYKGSLDKYKETKDVAYEKPAALELVYQSAKWSLTSNCNQYKLVKDYCNFIYENENLSPRVKMELQGILGR